MRPLLLDLIAPSPSEMLSDFIRENTVIVIFLLVVLLVIAVSVVNIVVLKHHRKTNPTDKTSPDNKDDK